jgi:hypothetical protein
MKAFVFYARSELGGMRVIAGIAAPGKKKEEGSRKNEEQRE